MALIYIESMATRPETFYTRKIYNYLIIRIKPLFFVQLLKGLNIIGQLNVKTSRSDDPTLTQDEKKERNFGGSLGLGLGLGFLYNIKNNIQLGFEMTPNVLVTYSEEVRFYNNTPKDVKSLITRQNFNTNNLSLSIIYFLRKD